MDSSKVNRFIIHTVIARRIVQNLKAKGMKQKHIAGIMGVSCAYVCMLLKNLRASSFELGERLSAYLDGCSSRILTREDYRRESKMLEKMMKSSRLYCISKE